MQQHYSLDECRLDASIITIGSFDGVHKGHQAIIKRLVDQARSSDLPSVVVTFYPHPVVVLRSLNESFYLTSPDERAALLGELGVDHVFTLTFTPRMAALTALEFMRILSDHLQHKRLLVGENFTLGKDQQGTLNLLGIIGKKLGYALDIIPLATENGEKISSRQIRALLSQGEVRRAAQLLGRNYSLMGTVAHGDGRGKRLGIPTANLKIWQEKLVPGRGIYAAWAYLGQAKYQAATNIGIRPTFQLDDPVSLIEAHLLNFDGDIYDSELGLEFVEFLRPELRFDSVQSLVAQMQQDIKRTRKVLSHV